MTAKESPYTSGFGPSAPAVYRAPISYPYRDPDGMPGAEAAEQAARERHPGT